MSVQEREQEKSLKTKKIATRITPIAGEKIFSVVPPFKLTCLMPAEDCEQVISKPVNFFSARTIWRPSEEQKYISLFTKLEKEGKIYNVGTINRKLQVELSDEGFKFIQEMDRKYQWI